MLHNDKEKEIYELFLLKGGLCTDSRTLKRGDIFIALKGEVFDGNDFIQEALDKGASCVIFDKDFPQTFSDERLYRVKNTKEFLIRFVRFHRYKMKFQLILIVGSNGKTTTRYGLEAVLKNQFQVVATYENENNEWGVLFSCLRINRHTEYAIIELGVRGPNEHQRVLSWIDPDMVIITSIGKDHLGPIGGEKGVLKSFSEVIQFVESQQKDLFIHRKDAEILGLKSYSFVHVIPENMPSWKPLCSWPALWDSVLRLIFYVASYLSCDEEDIKRILWYTKPLKGRGSWLRYGSSWIFMDAYNANPSSMKNSLMCFAQMTYLFRSILWIGSMHDLGEYTRNEHEDIYRFCQWLFLNFDKCGKFIFVGPYFQDIVMADFGRFYPVFQEGFEKEKTENSYVFMKASHAERFYKNIYF